MKHFPTFLLLALLLSLATGLHAIELTLTSPLEHQVVQRATPGKGLLRITGELSEDVSPEAAVQVRVGNETRQMPWLQVNSVKGRKIIASYEAPAGGWWKLEVRIMLNDKEIALGKVPHVGVGEVFVVAGQSNSANHGEEKQTPQTGLVASFDGTTWRLAEDPQPGASGGGGSFLPPLGDELARKLGVPIGFVACGIGATSVREWLPKGATFPNPPTIESRVEKRPDGLWMSKGDAYQTFLARMKPLGPRGFRAVLWHQGESDANQQDPTRTLPGELYREYLTTLITTSRRDIGKAGPWFVAQASYHVPGDEASPDIRAAQAAVCSEGTALAGPDTDSLTMEWREAGGQGVHFSGPGLKEHARLWLEKLAPWLDGQLGR